MRTKNRDPKQLTGQLIVFEGPDGTGKSRLSSELSQALRVKGVEVLHIAFPGTVPGSLGELVYQLHHDTAPFNIRNLEGSALQCLHVAAHLDAIEQTIKPAIKRGVTVILDRFWWSTAVYGAVGGVPRELLDALIRVEHIAWGELKPSRVFVLERSSPLKNVPKVKWEKFKMEYKALAIQERGQYPVHVIDNKTTVAEALNCITRALFEEEVICSEQKQSQTSLALFPKHSAESSASASEAWAPLKPTAVLDTYWKFAAARQEVFFKRFEDRPPPWSTDPILVENKFTNAYRASDRVSQYLIKDVIYEGDQTAEEVFFRVLLFKFFNKIETWELLKCSLDEISWKSFSIASYNKILEQAISKGNRIYSAAYIMPTGGRGASYARKHMMHLHLLDKMMHDNVPMKLQKSGSMEKGFQVLKSYPSLGDFLAYQYITDLNYSEMIEYSEMEFVVAGPGAIDGISKCFSDTAGYSEKRIIELMTDRQQSEFKRLGLQFRDLWGRPLQLIDCQNLFCEVGKYARLAHPDIKGSSGRTRIKQKFRSTKGELPYWYPPKWQINDKIARAL